MRKRRPLCVCLGVEGQGGFLRTPRDSEALPDLDLLHAGQRRKLPGGVGNLSRERGSPRPLLSLSGLAGFPPAGKGLFPPSGEGRGLGEVPDRSRAGRRRWVLRRVQIAPLPYHLSPNPAEHRVRIPNLGPDPQPPFPLFPRISGGGPGSARGRTFFAKKGKDAAARATGTSGSDSRHEWVVAPPPRDSRAGAGMSEGGYPPKWGDGAERCSPLPASDAPAPALSAACGLGSAVQTVGARLVRAGCGAG